MKTASYIAYRTAAEFGSLLATVIIAVFLAASSWLHADPLPDPVRVAAAPSVTLEWPLPEHYVADPVACVGLGDPLPPDFAGYVKVATSTNGGADWTVTRIAWTNTVVLPVQAGVYHFRVICGSDAGGEGCAWSPMVVWTNAAPQIPPMLDLDLIAESATNLITGAWQEFYRVRIARAQ